MSDGGLLAFASGENCIQNFQCADAIFGGDRVGQFIQRPLLGGEHHGFYIAESDALLIAGVQNQLLQLIGDHHHVAAERIHQLAGAIRLDLYVASGAILADPAHRLAFFHSCQLDDPAILTHSFANALVSLFVGQIHAPCIGRDADVISDKYQNGIRIWVFAVGFNRREFFLVRSASKQSFHPANEEDLKRRHQRRSPRAIQDFSQIRFSEIKIEQAKIAQLRRYQMLQNRFAATAAKECLVSYKNVSRTQPARLHLRDKAIRLREGPHQKPSKMFETSVRANSRESRCSAGESSSKKLLSSRETWYCSRKRYAGFSYRTLPWRSVKATFMVTTTSTLEARPVVESYVSGEVAVESTVPRNVASAPSSAWFTIR